MSETEEKEAKRFCDIVMKGGITSGIVYPLAVAKLSERFRFKSIGGTSAGAIAAAAAAAAELARDRGGFTRLRELPDFLAGAAPDGSGSNLLAFFQAQPETARIFRILLEGLDAEKGKGLAILGRVLSEYATAALLGSLVGLAFIALAVSSASGALMVVSMLVGILLAAIGCLAGAAWAAYREFTKVLPRNFYGLCTGMSDDFSNVGNHPPKAVSKPLTYWLTEYLNSFLERGPGDQPLTFGELWGTRDPEAERAINLEMITTCVTHGRPYRLPFRRDADVRENGLFYFHEDEFRKLFPRSVVDWMIANPRTAAKQSASGVRAALAAKKLFPLPDPADLPVVVAVRMSLSFPILLSAIPLYAVDRSRDRRGLAPERCWFTDGGLCSNFPLHFFDSPLPRWPTLSFNLVEHPDGTEPEELLNIKMVESNDQGIQENWSRFEEEERWDPAAKQLFTNEKRGTGKLLGFINGLITTMQNWTDNTQSRLPGFRDRIAHVGLTSREGGLNLNMPAERIRQLTERGEAAAEQFIDRFAVPATHAKMHWDNHRWVRLRSCLASLEAMLEKMERACSSPQPGDKDYRELIRSNPYGSKVPSYKWSSKEQHALAMEVMEQIGRLQAQIQKTTAPAGEGLPGTDGDGSEVPPEKAINRKRISLSDNAPRPRPELRPRAQI